MTAFLGQCKVDRSPMPFGSSEVFHATGWKATTGFKVTSSPMPFGSSEVFHVVSKDSNTVQLPPVTNAFRQFGGFPQVREVQNVRLDRIRHQCLSPMPFGSSEVFHSGISKPRKLSKSWRSPMPFGSSEVFHSMTLLLRRSCAVNVTNAFRQFGGFPRYLSFL